MGSIDIKVIEIISKKIGLEASLSITPGLSLTNEIGMDSLCFVETIIAIENEFRVEFDDHAAGDVVTVGDLIDMVKACLRAKVSAKRPYEYQAVWRKPVGFNKQISKE
jgi:acyl carrier protein